MDSTTEELPDPSDSDALSVSLTVRPDGEADSVGSSDWDALSSIGDGDADAVASGDGDEVGLPASTVRDALRVASLPDGVRSDSVADNDSERAPSEPVGDTDGRRDQENESVTCVGDGDVDRDELGPERVAVGVPRDGDAEGVGLDKDGDAEGVGDLADADRLVDPSVAVREAVRGDPESVSDPPDADAVVD
jgi:hypothetical protein